MFPALLSFFLIFSNGQVAFANQDAKDIVNSDQPEATMQQTEKDQDLEGQGAALPSNRADKSKCTMTFANVKKYLKEHQMVDAILPGRCAWQAPQVLEKNGFKKTHSTFDTAQENEVCVFEGSRSICQGKPVNTIAVKTKGEWFDGCSNNHSFLRERQLIGCYKK